MVHLPSESRFAALPKQRTRNLIHAKVCHSATDLKCLIDQWHHLQANALEPSIAAAPGWFAPMFQHAGGPENNVSVIATGAEDASYLTGIFPLQMQQNRWLAPVPVLTTWVNDFSFSGLPTVSSGDTQESLKAMLDCAASHFGARAVLFQKIPSAGNFATSLTETAYSLNLSATRFDPFERACLNTGKNFDTWYQESFKRKKRKEFRRLRTRLSEQGKLELCVHVAGKPLKQWIGEFVALEQAGWKGRRGTAIACQTGMADFLTHTLGALHETDDLIFWKLALNGKPIAMLFGMISGNRAWLGKIAYDEAYARYSPGVLLILDATADFLSRPNIEMVDSSAVPDHPMINHIWRDRLAMSDLMIATPGTSPAMFNALTMAERARGLVRDTAKSAYHRFQKGQAR